MKPICLIDLDGILADFELHALRLYNTRTGANLDESKAHEYIGDKVILESSIDQKQYRTPFSEPGFFLSLPVIEGAQEGVAKLAEHFQIYFVTTEYRSNQTCCYEKWRWLKLYFPEWSDNIVFTKHKELVYGDILIDDSPINLQKWADSWGGLNSVKTASLEYHWTDKEITSFYSKSWLELADKIVKGVIE